MKKRLSAARARKVSVVKAGDESWTGYEGCVIKDG